MIKTEPTYRAKSWPMVVLAVFCAFMIGTIVNLGLEGLFTDNPYAAGVQFVSVIGAILVLIFSMVGWFVLTRLGRTGWIAAVTLGLLSTGAVVALGARSPLFSTTGAWDFLKAIPAGGLAGFITWWIANRKIQAE